MPSLTRTIETERGYAGPSSSYGSSVWQWVWDAAEQSPELTWPLSIAVYDRMRRTDAQVASGLRAIMLSVLGKRYALDPNGADQRIVEHCSQDLGLPVMGQESEPPGRTRDRFSWRKHLRMAGSLKLAYGHMPFEQVYRIEGSGSGQLAHLRKLSPRMPATLAEIKVARDGGLDGIVQYGDGLRGVEIGVERLVMYTHEQEAGAWQGVSMLRPAYKDWLVKDRLVRVNAMMYERTGMGVPTAEAPEGERNLEQYEAIATSVRAGDRSGVGLPHGARLRIVGVEGTLPDVLAGIRYHDEQVARNSMSMFMQLGTTATGSRALGDTLLGFFDAAVDAFVEETIETANEHIVEDLVDLNYGEGERAPRIVHSPSDAAKDLTPSDLKALVDAGVIEPDEALEANQRSRYRLPAKDMQRILDRPTVVPVAAGARARSSRRRPARPAAAADSVDSAPALPLGDLPAPFDALYDARATLAAEQTDELEPVLLDWAEQLDTTAIGTAVEDMAGILGIVQAAAEPAPELPIIEATAASLALLDSSVLRDQVHDALVAAWATGQVEGATLLNVGVSVDVDLPLVFDTAVDAAEQLDDLWSSADRWIADHVGVVSRAVGQAAKTRLLEAGFLSRLDMTLLLAEVKELVGSIETARVLFEHALTTALGEGSRALYASEGVAEVDFLTAADDRVDDLCRDVAGDNPHPIGDSPEVPQHIGCRCCLAPSTDAIRLLLT